MKKLYIFATSSRPDVYINTLAYCIEHLNVGSIYVIVISEHDYPEKEQEAQLMATDVLSNIITQLRTLADGQYISFFGKTPQQNKYTKLENRDGIDIYSQCLDTINESGNTGIAIQHETLGIHLQNYIKQGNCIFDVSALKKNLLIDVVTTLISYGFSEVHNFELNKKPSHDQNDLYHNLSRQDFQFRNLTISKPVEESLQRISRWALRSQAIFVFTAVIALFFIPISIFWPDSTAVAGLNTVAIVASISSYLFLLRQEGNFASQQNYIFSEFFVKFWSKSHINK